MQPESPQPGPDTAYVRAYAPPKGMRPINREQRRKLQKWLPRGILIHDTETSADALLRLRFGCWYYCRLRFVDGVLMLVCVEEGLFYADELPDHEPDGCDVLCTYAQANVSAVDPFTLDADRRLQLISQREFIERRLIPAMEDKRTWVCGLNLAFDLTRLAVHVGRTRPVHPALAKFKNGFSCALQWRINDDGEVCSESPHFGRLWIASTDSKWRHFRWTRRTDDLKRGKAKKYARPRPKSTDKSAANGKKSAKHRGHFLDLSPLTRALSGQPGSLEGGCETFRVLDPELLADALARVGFTPEEVALRLSLVSVPDLTLALMRHGPDKLAHSGSLPADEAERLAQVLTDFVSPRDDERPPTFRKREVEHGAPIISAYIGYCRRDVWATAALCEALLRECCICGLWTSPTKVRSAASIAKDLYDRAGITPLLERQPEIDPRALGYAMSAFYGGRAEVKHRRNAIPVRVRDATSMYPTGAANMQLHRFDTCAEVRVRISDSDANIEAVSAALDSLTADDILEPALHPQLVFFARIEPRPGDILPLRMDYAGNGSHGIGLEEIEDSDVSPWYGGPDLACSKVLSGQTPRILEVLLFDFHGEATGLRRVQLPDGSSFDPRRHDPNVKLIEARKKLVSRPGLSAERRTSADRFLKEVTNSLYGMTAEMNRQHRGESERSEEVCVHGLWSFERDTNMPETPGEFFNPFRAALTTAWARLILGTAERLVLDAGGDVAVMDTDSLISTGLPWEEEGELFNRFDTLNPYDPKLVPHFWKLEKVNFEENDPAKPRRQLWCFAISAKRYCLFTFDASGERRIVGFVDVPDDGERHEAACIQPADEAATVMLDKVEMIEQREHGLGHLVDPTGRKALVPESWGYMLRREHDPDTPEPDWFGLPAMSRLTISTWEMLRPFTAWNAGKPYAEQIKPFNFLNIPHVRRDGLAPGVKLPTLVGALEDDARLWTNVDYLAKASADGQPYHLTFDDYDPREPHEIPVWTYGDEIERYRTHPEAKSAASDGKPCRPNTIGRLQRRRVHIREAVHIGKETNKLEEREAGYANPAECLNRYDDPNRSLFALYGRRVAATFSTAQVREATRRGSGPVLAPTVREARAPSGQSLWTTNAAMSERTLRNIISGKTKPTPGHERVVTAALVRLAAEQLHEWCVNVPFPAAGSPFVAEAATLSQYLSEIERRGSASTCEACGLPLAGRQQRWCAECAEKGRKQVGRAARLDERAA